MFTAAVTTVAFFVLAVIAVAFAIAAVITKRIFRSAIYLMGTLTTSAAFYILLGAEFLAGVQILVYVGGIVVLIVFAVMLTSSNEMMEDNPSTMRKLLGYIVATGFYVMTVFMFLMTKFHVTGDKKAQQFSDTAIIGRKLLDYGSNGYVLPFEIISLLLLCVVIGAIVIARKTKTPAE
jgi:NADH-quinone oxidoreductase subunit J